MVKNFTTFEPDLIVSGVVANQCGSERHEAWLADSLKSASLPPLVGAVPRGAFLELPGRHLGLVTADSRVLPECVLGVLADAAEQYVSIDYVLSIARGATPLGRAPAERSAIERRVRIGVARDEAFHFYYQDTFDEMEIRGCELVWFSPVNDARLPDELDGLYIGGGYPEASVEALSANETMLDSIRQFAQTDRPIYAECGGLMLSEGLRLLTDSATLVGLLHSWTRMQEKENARICRDCAERGFLWGARGDVLRGHEFHYSN